MSRFQRQPSQESERSQAPNNPLTISYVSRAESRSEVDPLPAAQSNDDGLNEISSSYPRVTTIGKYIMVGHLGSGGFGNVFRCEEPHFMDGLPALREVAVKVPFQAIYGPNGKEQFFEEAMRLAKFSHPAICGVYQCGETADGKPYLVMPLLSGKTLDQEMLTLSRGDVREERRLLRAFVDVLDGLQAAHEKGFVHRDLKPSNIMIKNDNTGCILDFGLAAALQSTSQGEKVPGSEREICYGTANYMSPEQARAEAIDCRSDIFSMGTILYEMATEKLPYRDNDESQGTVMRRVAYGTQLPVRDEFSNLDPNLQKIIEKALERDPIDRFQSAAEMKKELQNYIRSLEKRIAHEEREPLLRRALSWFENIF